MSIIQTIRDKGAKVAVVLIALALLGFIAMDALTGRSNLFGGSPSTTVGKVNGESIRFESFRSIVDQQENNLVQQGNPGGEVTRQRAIDDAWNQEVSRRLIQGEVEKLGIDISSKELTNSILFGNNPPDDLKRNFTDANGVFNAQQAAQQIRDIQKKGTIEQKANIEAYLEQLQFVRKMEKYNSMMFNTIHYPKWLLEKQNADNAQIARISFVKKAYSEVPDSSIQISDADINDYVKKHKKDFKQEESRSITYATFQASPNGGDTMRTIQKLNDLKPGFDTVSDVARYLAAEGVQNYYPGFINGKTIQIANKDSIFRTPVGAVYGPYLDGGSVTIAKMIAARPIPDTVKLRHILIATTQTDQQTGAMQQIRDTATARHLIDSVRGLILAGQPFDSVCAKLSEDPGSKDNGGKYDFPSGPPLAVEFNNFIFTNPPGSKGIVSTVFGYHYIEVLEHKGSGTGYQIAYISKPIIASTETVDNARNEASKFAGDAKDEKSFNAEFDKQLKSKGYNKGVATDIRPISFDIQGLGTSRDFVRKIYDAKKGDVVGPDRVGENYVVAVVTEIHEEGTQPASKARFQVEPILRNKKKAELIKKQIGSITTLEAAATALGKPIESLDSVRISGAPALGFETRLLGAAFNPANRGKVVTEAIEGSSGVYVLRVDNVSATAAIQANIADQQRMMYEQNKQRAQQYFQPLQAIREAASIKDYRYKHY